MCEEFTKKVNLNSASAVGGFSLLFFASVFFLFTSACFSFSMALITSISNSLNSSVWMSLMVVKRSVFQTVSVSKI